MQVGERLRQLRRERGLSMSRVADGTGLSSSFLSLVETGRSDISLGRLLRLLAFYGVRFEDVVPDPPDRDQIVVRADDREHVTSTDEGIDIALLAPDLHRGLTPTLVTVEPGRGHDEPVTYPAEQFMHVVAGRLELRLGDREPLELGAGDSAYFDAAATTHTLYNPGDTLAVLICVSTRMPLPG